ncbi:MAG: PEGA domain-containing protein [Bacteroidales bacterium]
MPYGLRKITIKHPELGMLRNYIYPEAIKKATVYEMVLTTGKVVTTVEEVENPTQYLIITSEPEGATVFIDEQQVGTTTFQRKYEEGGIYIPPGIPEISSCSRQSYPER